MHGEWKQARGVHRMKGGGGEKGGGKLRARHGGVLRRMTREDSNEASQCQHAKAYHVDCESDETRLRKSSNFGGAVARARMRHEGNEAQRDSSAVRG